MFGPVASATDRPFGNAVIDGFDLDFEAATEYLPAFGAKLRGLIDGAHDKKFYLAAAPQCVFPDAALGSTLSAVPFDFVMIQFYNNYCGVSSFSPSSTEQTAFNMDVWGKWASASKNPDTKLLLGIPAATGAGGGYTTGSRLKAAIEYCKSLKAFGGVMMWDMSQLYGNRGFLDQIAGSLEDSATQISIKPMAAATVVADHRIAESDSVIQWGQCGGQGWSGPITCQPPYECVALSQWWSSCR